MIMDADLRKPEPVVVLVRPQMGENIGFVIRAMANFGLRSLRLVQPRDGWPSKCADATSVGGENCLEPVQVFETLEDALSDQHTVIAATRRDRANIQTSLNLSEAIGFIQDEFSRDCRVALMCGPERSGLDNEDLSRAHAILSLDVNPEFPSLNLAHAVVVFAHAWSVSAGHPLKRLRKQSSHYSATIGQVDEFFYRIEMLLESKGYFDHPQKEDRMRRNLRHLLTKAKFSRRELDAISGVVRRLVADDSN